MSESKFKVPRKVEEIQGEYQTLCTKAGHIQYQVVTLQKDLGLINDTLRDLNQEAYMAQQAQAEAAKEKTASEAAKESSAQEAAKE